MIGSQVGPSIRQVFALSRSVHPIQLLHSLFILRFYLHFGIEQNLHIRMRSSITKGLNGNGTKPAIENLFLHFPNSSCLSILSSPSQAMMLLIQTLQCNNSKSQQTLVKMEMCLCLTPAPQITRP